MKEKDPYIVVGGVLKGFKGNTKTLIVPNSVYKIEPHILWSDIDQSYEVDSLYIPSSVKIISSLAFGGIPTKKITLNEGLEEIGPYAFEGPVNTVTIPSSTHTISEAAFTQCSLTSLEVADVASHVYYFKKCYGEKIHTLTIRNENNNVLKIVKMLKKQSVNISRLIIKGSAITNELKNQIREVYPSIISITDDTKAFYKDNIDSASPKKFDPEWIVDETTLKGYKGSQKEIEIPEGIEKISDQNFFNQYKLNNRKFEKVSFPNSLKKIGEDAFSKNRLANISFPPSLEEIGRQAFYGNLLEEIAIPQSVTKIFPYAFDENPLKRIELYDTFASYSQEVNLFGLFVNLDLLEEITIHNSVGIALDLLTMLPRNTKEQLKVITIMDNTITFEEQLKLEKMFPNLETINFKRVHKKTNVKSWLLPENLTIPIEEVNGWNSVQDNCDITMIDSVILSKYYTKPTITLPTQLTVLGESSLKELQLSGVIFQEGLTTIKASALERNNIRTLSFPSTLTFIGNSALKDNMLTSLRFDHDIKVEKDAFKGNPIRTVHITDTFKDLEGLKSALDCTVENLYIDNLDGNFANIIDCFKEHPLKRIVFTGKKITFKEKFEIMGAIGRPVAIDNKSTRLEIIDQKTKSETKNSEISDAFAAIKKMIDTIPAKYRAHFQNKVKTLQEKYQKDLDDYSPDFDIETIGLPRLTMQASPEQIKRILLTDLREMQEMIQVDKPLYDLQSDLYAYIFILNTTPIEQPNSVATIREKLSFISCVTSQNNNKNIIEEIRGSIEKLQKKIDDILEADLPESISFDSVREDLERIVDAAFKKTCDFEKKCKILKGEGKEELAQDIKTLKSIINSLDNLNKEWLIKKLNNILENYLSKKEPLDEKMTIDIRRDLHPLIEEVNQVAKNTFDKKDILNILQEFLKRLYGKQHNFEIQNILLMDLTALFENIMALLENQYIEPHEKEHTIKKIQHMLESYILILNRGESISSESAITKGFPNFPDNLDILPESHRIIIKISSQLSEIKYLLEEKIAKEKEVAEFKNNNF